MTTFMEDQIVRLNSAFGNARGRIAGKFRHSGYPVEILEIPGRVSRPDLRQGSMVMVHPSCMAPEEQETPGTGQPLFTIEEVRNAVQCVTAGEATSRYVIEYLTNERHLEYAPKAPEGRDTKVEQGIKRLSKILTGEHGESDEGQLDLRHLKRIGENYKRRAEEAETREAAMAEQAAKLIGNLNGSDGMPAAWWISAAKALDELDRLTGGRAVQKDGA